MYFKEYRGVKIKLSTQFDFFKKVFALHNVIAFFFILTISFQKV